ncbi:MAG: RodZ domain-containing protein [Chloroflexota bacterium]
MDELGAILRDAREAKGLTLAAVQNRTRITTRFLEALENGQYDLLPTPVHVRGYLRNYARCLGLDPQPLLERYELSQNRRPAPVAASVEDISPDHPLPDRRDQPFFNPVNVQLGPDSGRRDRDATLRLIIIVALLIALGLVANRFVPLLLGRGDGSQELAGSLTDAVSEIINNEPATPTPPPEETATGEPVVSTSRNNQPAAGPTPTPTRPPLPATMERIRLRLEITERTWMQVAIDGEVVFEGLARRGEGPFEWEALQEARFLTGNAIGVFVTINDVPLGKLGGRGEVVDETWSTTGQ